MDRDRMQRSPIVCRRQITGKTVAAELPPRLARRIVLSKDLVDQALARCLSSKKQLSGRRDMKMISKRLIALALMSTVYSSSSWAITWDTPITNVVGNSDAGDKNFTAPNGDLGDDKGRTKELRVPTAGINKTGADFKGKWNGQISFIHADNHESGSYTCKLKKKSGGYYIFTIQH
jgi:hypothetical protein